MSRLDTFFSASSSDREDKMPASLYELERSGGGGGSNGLDERTLQLAFELTMLGFGDHISSSPSMPSSVDHNTAAHHDSLDGVTLTNHIVGGGGGGFASSAPVPDDSRSKKSQNMTECVPVPSSEHVAEIVGRQGCKIKALRAKTNTYIKTPVRGEEPVFVVTGRKEDVAKAKREILSAAEHFSQIRASRKTNMGGILGGVLPAGPQANIPGQVTIQVRVPYRVVGLVVGPKGATIKRIQQQTYTYIVTPSRDKEPVFEVTGMPEDVEAARREIEAHIAVRTGAQCFLNDNLADLLIEDHTELLASLYKTGFGSLFSYLDPSGTNNSSVASDTTNMFPSTTSHTSSTSSGAFSSSGSISSSSSSSTGRLGDLVSIWNSNLERDEGIGESPGFETSSSTGTGQSNIWSFPSSGNSTGVTARPSPATSASPTESLPSITGLSLTSKRECLVCGEKEVNAALVPCRHNLFCLDCAVRLCDGADPVCPVCSRTACRAVRIL